MRSPSCRPISKLVALGAAALALAACGDGDSNPPPPPAYSQADLAGTWHFSILFSGTSVAAGAPGWARGTLSIDGSGNRTFLTYENSAGSTVLPSVAAIYSLNSAGVVTATSTAFTGMYGKMSPSKSIFVTTATQSGVQRLDVYQRVVAGTVYGPADLASDVFSIHQVKSGAAAEWHHATATIDGAGVVSLTDRVTPAGAQPDQPSLTTISVDSSGIVTVGVNATFQGFLSADKELFVGTETQAANDHALTIATRAGSAHSQADLVGSWTYNGLATVNPGGAAAWVHGTISFDAAGVSTPGMQYDSAGGSAVPSPITLAVAPDGTVTQTAGSAPDLHGALTRSNEFFVATQTFDVGLYGMIVAIR